MNKRKVAKRVRLAEKIRRRFWNLQMDHGTAEEAGAQAGRREAGIRVHPDDRRELLGIVRHNLATNWLLAKYARKLVRFENAFTQAYDEELKRLEAEHANTNGV